MKFTRKLIVALLTLAVVLAPCAATVQAAPKVPKSQTVYLSGKGQYTKYSSSYNILIPGLSKSQAQKVTGIKSSNTKVVQSASINLYGTLPIISLNISYKNVGRSTVSFKIGSKTYQTKVTVKKYENPAKSFSITGVKSKGRSNLASLLNDKCSSSILKVSSMKEDPTIKVSAKKGWKVSKVEYLTAGPSKIPTKKYKNPVSSATLKTEFKPNYVYVTFVNTNTKGSLRASYTFG